MHGVTYRSCFRASTPQGGSGPCFSFPIAIGDCNSSNLQLLQTIPTARVEVLFVPGSCAVEWCHKSVAPSALEVDSRCNVERAHFKDDKRLTAPCSAKNGFCPPIARSERAVHSTIQSTSTSSAALSPFLLPRAARAYRVSEISWVGARMSGTVDFVFLR